MADEQPQRGVKQRNKIVMSQEEIDEFLSGRRSMTMSTINPDGSIHSIAMWYGFLEGCIGIESKAKAQKVMNLRRNPNLTMLVEDGETYETLRGVTLIGKGEIMIPYASGESAHLDCYRQHAEAVARGEARW